MKHILIIAGFAVTATGGFARGRRRGMMGGSGMMGGGKPNEQWRSPESGR